MKTLATIAAAALLTLPSVAAAACTYHQQTAQISCADGQVYDEESRACVPASS